MKRRLIIIICICVILAGVIILVNIPKSAEYVEKVSSDKVDWAYRLLSDASGSEVMYADYLRYTEFIYATEDAGNFKPERLDVNADTAGDNAADSNVTESSVADNDIISIDYGESAEYKVMAPQAGWYEMKLEYMPTGTSLSDFNIDIKINDEQSYYEMRTIVLPQLWSDATKSFPLDSYGDEAAPAQVQMSERRTVSLYNNTYSSQNPLLFELQSGENTVTVTNVSANGLGIGCLSAVAPKRQLISYAEYREQFPAAVSAAETLITINATEYTQKNSTQAIYSSENNPALTPHDTEYKKLNVLSWTDSGTQISYNVAVTESGWYELAFHYKNRKEEFDIFNTIILDGEIPFTECMGYRFVPTGSTWSNEVLSDENGAPFRFYLEAGMHTLSIKTEREQVDAAWRYAKLISEHVGKFALQITNIAGSEVDKNRTWKMTKYIPEIPDYLEAYSILIDEIRYLLQDYSEGGINGALLADLDKAMQFIDGMAEYPDEIALYTADLTGRDNSVIVALSNFTSEINQQDFSLDMIYVYNNSELPDATAGAFDIVGNWIMTLVNSFTSEKYQYKAEEDVLTIWVNRAVTHVDLLQRMVDTDFTPKTGIKVKVSAMPDANKLTLSVSAGNTPDVALGLASHMPFDLASRGALYDMTQFEDFWEISNRFVAGAFVPYVFNEGVYALPETLDFDALVYRTDIFENIGLTPPDTWQDVVDMLPELQRYGMNFYHNVSAGVGYKWFYQTSPLILQNNGQLYSEDGLRTAIDTPDSVKGIQALGNLFTAYSLDIQVNSFFNSFRYSLLPVGIIDSATYILLKNGAPELEGQWALSAYPGTKQEDGSVSRWYIANGTGGIIFKASEKTDEAWEFLKWWTGHDTQVDYTYTLRSTYGKQFFWLPSNIEAVEDAPIDQDDKVIILEQLQWLRDIPRTPGQYQLERSISDIWNAIVLDGATAQVAIDERVIDINREMKKKMKELDFYDDEGNVVSDYVIRDIDWIKEKMQGAK